MILLIDNYDSFVFNLYQGLGMLGADVRVVRNDELDVAEALALDPSALVLSPGPGRPADAGICLDLVRALPAGTPLLGVCLGHQTLVESEGGALEVDGAPLHGKSSLVHHTGEGIFDGMPSPLTCGRYHSLRARADALPRSLRLTAWTEDGAVMAVEHRSMPRFGVQFHPESILTPLGMRLLGRFLSMAGESVALEAVGGSLR
ncbi:MAG: aminodeoxychorismate/anthranilate synthase component II [Planctomycetota bacterium]|nr:aminodeoxychorismate/anthranilate synthase component II [Planctomycetota bacterium]MEE2938845.1 aminodeoxychorismate/anthranilate synthase component II [Planctomycetota bacterium]